MAIDAVSSVINRSYSNINFEGKKNKQTQVPVTSPLKAVPLAVLIAMSPLTETSAREIMRPEVTELVQSQQKNNIIYSHTFNTEKLSDVKVQAINTKGNLDGFDKIKIKIFDYEFDVQDVNDVETYLVAANGLKEGPLTYREVRVKFDRNEDITPAFVDEDVVNYVSALVSSKDNKSEIKSIEKKQYNILPFTRPNDIFDSSLKDKPDYTDYTFLITNEDNILKNVKLHKPRDFGRSKSHIKGADKTVMGSYGNYIIRFYDRDNNQSNFEEITIQKDGEEEFRIYGISNVNIKLSGLDADIFGGNTGMIYLDSYATYPVIFDDDLCNSIKEFLKQKFPEPNLKINNYFENETANIDLNSVN